MRFRVVSPLKPEDAFARVADFGRLQEWDPAVVESVLVNGTPVSTGAVYRLRSPRWLGGVILTYEIVMINPPRMVTYQGGSKRVRSTDRITVDPSQRGSVVSLTTELETSGPRWVLPLVKAFVWLSGRTMSLPALRRWLSRSE